MKRLMLLMIVFCFGCILLAQSTISLEEAIEMARENNLSLQSSFFQMESARWAYQNSRTQFMPKINFVYTGIVLDQEIESFGMVLQDKQNHVTSLQVEQTLFAGGRVYNANQMSRLQYEMSQNDYQKMQLETDSRVTENYYALLRTSSTINIMEHNLSLCNDLKENTEILFRNGIGVETDVMQWELTIIEIENQLNALNNAFETQLQGWALILGIEDIYNIPVPEYKAVDDTMLEIREFAMLDNSIKSLRMNDFLTRVQQGNFDLINLGMTQETLQYSRRMSRADFMPSVFASFSSELSNDTRIDQIRFLRDPSWQVMVNVSIPLFHSFRNITNYRANEYQVMAQNRNLEEGTRGIEIQARQAWLDFDSSVNNVLQNEKHQNLAERSLEATRNLYQQGMTTNVALTDAQNSAMASAVQYINSIHDYINAKNRLNNMIGGNQ